MLHWWAILMAVIAGLGMLSVWSQAPGNPLAGVQDIDGNVLFDKAVEAEITAWAEIEQRWDMYTD